MTQAGAITAEPIAASAPPETGVTEPELAQKSKASKRDRDRDRDDDEEDDDDRPRRRDKPSGTSDAAKAAAGAGAGIGMVLLILGVTGCCVVGVGAVLVALLVPAVQKGARRRPTQSINNLKQIGLAFHSFHDAHRQLPFNGVGPAAPGNNLSGSWGFQILPFIGEARCSRASSARQLFLFIYVPVVCDLPWKRPMAAAWTVFLQQLHQ